MTVSRQSAPMVSEKSLPAFSFERCKRCGICSHFCPVDAIRATEDGIPELVDPQACTSCRLCEELCPDWAIEMIPGGTPVQTPEEEARRTRAAEPVSETPACHVFDVCEE